MKKIRPSFFLTLLSLVCLNSFAQEVTAKLSAEKIAILKATSFKDKEGKEVKLEQFKDKIVIVDFWETWCKPCVESMPALDMIATQYKDKVVILAVNSFMKDDEERFQKFTSKHKYHFEYSTCNQVLKELDIHFIPYQIFFDERGNYRESYEATQQNTDDEYDEIEGRIKKITGDTLSKPKKRKNWNPIYTK